jgi:hypothetical protein
MIGLLNELAKSKSAHISPQPLRIKLGQVIYSITTTCPFVHRADRFPKSIIERLPKVLLRFQLTTDIGEPSFI